MAITQCRICNRDYEVCNDCLSQKTLRPWRSVVDTLEHYKIYYILHDYSVTKNKEEAKAELQKCDLSDMENFVPEIKEVINEIIEDVTKGKHSSKKIVTTETDSVNPKNDVE